MPRPPRHAVNVPPSPSMAERVMSPAEKAELLRIEALPKCPTCDEQLNRTGAVQGFCSTCKAYHPMPASPPSEDTRRRQ